MTPIPPLNPRDVREQKTPKWIEAMRRSSEATEQLLKTGREEEGKG